MRDGPRCFRQDFTCPALLRNTLGDWPQVAYGIVTPFDSVFHRILLCRFFAFLVFLQPRICVNRYGLGSCAFARHYSRNHFCFLFLQVIRCFSSLRLPPPKRMVYLPYTGLPHSDIRESSGYLHLIPAFRSLSRPSSPPRAKASTVCPFFAYRYR